MPAKKKASAQRSKTLSGHLRGLESDVMKRAAYDLIGEGPYVGVLKNGFIKAFEFARYSNRIDSKKADEGAYFMASALRGICEDLIALTFLRQLSKELRDEVVMIDAMNANRKVSVEQRIFFKTVRPFQPVLTLREDAQAVADAKDRLTEIGRMTGRWEVEKKLPPIQQMAQAVGMKALYDYFYRITSDTVHFNPRVALRNGWGDNPRNSRFGMKNFCRYYLYFSQIYGIFLFNAFCQSFKAELALSDNFMDRLRMLESDLNRINRWPEALTYEEMNQPSPNFLIRTVLQLAHEQGRDKELKEKKSKKGKASDH